MPLTEARTGHFNQRIEKGVVVDPGSLSARQAMNHQGRRGYRAIILVLVGSFLTLVAFCWGSATWTAWQEKQLAFREDQLASRPTTPELVVQAFRDAHYQINDLEFVQGRGSLHPLEGSPERYISFKAHGGSQGDFADITVSLYESKDEAEKRATRINQFYKQLGGGFPYAYRRGSVLMAVYSESRVERAKTEGECKEVFESAAEP